jgi:hypothetical protein
MALTASKAVPLLRWKLLTGFIDEQGLCCTKSTFSVFCSTAQIQISIQFQCIRTAWSKREFCGVGVIFFF